MHTRGRERLRACARVRLGFCILLRALVRSRKKAAAVSAKSEKGGGDARSILLKREYPRWIPAAMAISEIQRLVLGVMT